jgi:hypothetical protein
VLVAVCVFFLLIARLQKTRLSFGMDIARDWLPIFFIFFAFREMDYFAPHEYDFLSEMSWIRWDLVILEGLNLTRRIESLGPVILPGGLCGGRLLCGAAIGAGRT